MTRQMTTLELDLRAPGGEPVDLWRTLISHGFAGLSPTVLDEEHRSLAFTIRVPGGRPRRVRVSEDAGNGRGGHGADSSAHGPARRLRRPRAAAHVLLSIRTSPSTPAVTIRSSVAAGAPADAPLPTVFEDVARRSATPTAWSATIRRWTLVTNLGDPGSEATGRSRRVPDAHRDVGFRSVLRDVVAGYRGAYLLGWPKTGRRLRSRPLGLRNGDARVLPTQARGIAPGACPGSGGIRGPHHDDAQSPPRLILDSWPGRSTPGSWAEERVPNRRSSDLPPT